MQFMPRRRIRSGKKLTVTILRPENSHLQHSACDHSQPLAC
jgi:hypothetical protein